MKKHTAFLFIYILVCLILIIFFLIPKTHAQVYGSIKGTSQGFGLAAGILAQNIQLQAGYEAPIRSAEIPNTVYATVGWQLLLTNRAEDNYSLVASAGICHNSYTSFTDHPDGIKVQKILPVYSAELGKDIYMGRLFISAHYTNKTYLGAGMRIFLNR